MRASTVSIVILSALALLAPAAQAAAPRTVASCDAARVDKAAGVARTLSDCGKVDLGRGAEGAARQALGRLSGALGVRRDTSDLGLMSATPTTAPARACASSSTSRASRSATARSRSRSTRTAPCSTSATAPSPDQTLDTNARVSRAEALLTARRRVPVGRRHGRRAEDEPRRRADRARRLELAWLVLLPVRAPRGDWNVVVSARSGEVLQAYDSLTRVDGTALTYAPNPVQQTGNTGLRDDDDADPAALTAARQALTLTDLNAGTNLLRGTYVDTAPPRASPRLHAAVHAGPGVERRAHLQLHPQPGRVRGDRRLRRDHARPAQLRRARLPGDLPRPRADQRRTASRTTTRSTPTDRRRAAHGRRRRRRRRGRRRDRPRVRPRDPGRPGARLGPRRATPSSVRWARASATSSPPTPTSRTATRLPGHAPLLRRRVGRDLLQPVDGPESAAAAACAGSTAPNENDGSDIGTYGGTPNEEHNDGRYWSAMLTCVFKGIEPAIGTAQARDRMLTLVLAHHFDLTPTSGNTAFADVARRAARRGRGALRRRRDRAHQRLRRAAARHDAPADTTPPVVNGSLIAGRPGRRQRLVPHRAGGRLDRDRPAIRLVGTTGCERRRRPGRHARHDDHLHRDERRRHRRPRSLSYKKDGTAPALAAALSRRADGG